MGLLDDAIREHLELKRRRGADPGMVAREQRDALEPVFSDHHDDRADGDASGADAEQGGADAPIEGHRAGDAELADLSTGGQETAELDMQAVLDEDADASAAATEGVSGEDGHAPEGRQDPSLEWEDSSRAAAEPVAEDISAQERLSFE